ncbi:MAG: OmpH family outer membrane protein [Phycisphaerales bacterium]|nr:OmpH family outer membrane protein [Phycisphaerales bacterium]
MRRTERALVYGLLAVLLGLNLVPLLDRVPLASAVAAPALDDPDLGPAPALLLKGDKGDLRLTNRKGRLAWGKDPSAQAYSVAFVNVGQVMRQLQSSDTFREEAETLANALQEKDADYRRRLDELTKQLDTLDRESDEFKRLYDEGGSLYKEFMEWGGQAVAQRDRLEATHIEKAYRQLIEAVEVVADRLDVDVVYRFIATSDPFQSQNVEGAVTEVRLRTVLRYPEGLDMTPEVLRELNLKDE